MGTVVASAIETAQGLYLGHYFVSSKQYSEEVKQGKNYYLAAPFQFCQALSCNWMIDHLLDCAGDFPLKGTLSKTKAVVLYSFTLPFFFLAAIVRHGDYEKFVGFWDQVQIAIKNEKPNWSSYLSYLPDLPKTLSTHTVAFLRMAAEHADKAMHFFLVASSIIAKKRYAFGLGFLAMFAYAWVDERGWVKREWSLFVERYAPVLSFSCFKDPSIVSLLTSLPQATFLLLPKIKKAFLYSIDEQLNKYLPAQLYPLRQVDAPLIERRNLNYEDCTKILEFSKFYFDVNPSHCAAWAYDLSSFPRDTEFSKFLTLFEKVDWKEKYTLIIPKLLDDERFQAILTDKFPDISLEDLKKEIDTKILQLGLKGNTKQECAAEWLQQQMKELIDVLLNKKHVKGKQKDLEDALPIYAIILPYLSALQPKDIKKPEGKETLQDREFQDVLLKIAVEGGGYCARGIKRVAFEFRGYLLRNKMEQNKLENANPMNDYEMLINQALQELRSRILEKAYKENVKKIKGEGADNTTSGSVNDVHNEGADNPISGSINDVHNLDAYRVGLGLGFHPLTPNEKESFSFGNYFIWRNLEQVRQGMYDDYKKSLDSIIKENGGEAAFSEYIVKTINSLPNLQKDEKEKLLEIYQGTTGWYAVQINESFHRLMFVILGILKVNEVEILKYKRKYEK